jgi:hypothetical protein
MKTARFLLLGGTLALGGVAAFQASRIFEIAHVPIVEIVIGTISPILRSTSDTGPAGHDMASLPYGLASGATHDA